METLQIWITHYGYFGIFALLVLGIVGIPIPDETLMALTGYLVYKGDLNLLPAFSAAYFGSIIGISISYAIGSTFGYYALIKYGHLIHITEERLEKAHNWFEKIGGWALLIGYFIPGVRHIVAILAGTSKLRMWEFALFAYTGAFIWASTFISIGYFFGEKWEIFLKSIHRHLVLFAILLIIIIIIGFYIKNKIKNNKK